MCQASTHGVMLINVLFVGCILQMEATKQELSKLVVQQQQKVAQQKENIQAVAEDVKQVRASTAFAVEWMPS